METENHINQKNTLNNYMVFVNLDLPTKNSTNLSIIFISLVFKITLIEMLRIKNPG